MTTPIITQICELGAAHYRDTRSAAAAKSLLKHIRKLPSLDGRDIALWRDKLSDRYTPNTVRRTMGILRAMLQKAEEYGIIDNVPKIKLPSAPPGRVGYLSSEEEEQLLLALKNREAKALASFLIDTGMRAGEALGWNGKVKSSEDGFLVTLEKTKTDRARTIPLTDRAASVASKRPRGFRINYQGFYKQWQKARKQLGQTDNKLWVPHILRHTFASRLAQRGAPIATISQLLGHQSLEQTMVYAHLSLDCLRQSIDLIRNGERARDPKNGSVSAESPAATTADPSLHSG